VDLRGGAKLGVFQVFSHCTEELLMKNSWTQTFRRLASLCVVAGSTAFSSAACYAIHAFDSAADPVYADGWQAGDNGGTGFTPWNFDTDTFTMVPGLHLIDDGLQAGGPTSSPFNAIGRAWRMSIPPDGLPRAGRGFAPLQIGQTLSVTIDNPTERAFFKGYFIRLNTGGGNICYGDSACTTGTSPVQKMRFQTFEYFTNGKWGIDDSTFNNTTLLDVDTAAAGAVFKVTRTGAETYDVLMDPLGAAPSFTASRTFKAGGPVDWIEFTMFNTPTNPTADTDLFIRSIEIVPEPASGVLRASAAGMLAMLGRAGRRRE
jgi:hypothetical protein